MKKRIIINIMALLMIFTVFAGACAPKAGDIPTYEDTEDKKIRIFGACNPPASSTLAVKMYRECGINSYAIYNDDYYENEETGKMDHRILANVSEWDKQLQAITDADLDIFIRGLNEHYYEEFDYDFRKFERVKGLYVWDEPGYNQYDTIANRLVPWVNEHYPDLIWYINLYPSYAYTGRSLGTEADNSYPGYSTYEKYIYGYVDKVLNKVKGEKVLSLDHYPLRVNNRNVAYINSSWLQDLMIGKMGAIKANCPFACCIQCYDNANPIRNIKSKADLKFQVYTSFAFGVTGLEYYQYGFYGSSEGEWDGLVDRNWAIRPSYYYAQSLNQEISRFEHVLLSFDWEGVYCNLGKEGEGYSDAFDALDTIKDTRRLNSLKNVNSVESRYDAIIGQFVDGEGRNGYMIVNYTEPTEKKVNSVELGIKKFAKALVFRNGYQTEEDIVDGKLEIMLNEGEGVFVIPY